MTVATWLENLLPPKATQLAPTVLVKKRKLQDGSFEIRRFGDSGPDKINATWDFVTDDYEDFKDFYEEDCKKGEIWFSADWLEDLGYTTSHAARFMSYMDIEGNAGTVIVNATLLIQHQDNI